MPFSCNSCTCHGFFDKEFIDKHDATHFKEGVRAREVHQKDSDMKKKKKEADNKRAEERKKREAKKQAKTQKKKPSKTKHESKPPVAPKGKQPPPPKKNGTHVKQPMGKGRK